MGVLPERFEALVGHKEATERLPDDAVLLASSSGCPVQVYRVGRRVYATQFHPEVSRRRLRRAGAGVPAPRLLPRERARAFIDRLAAASVTEPQRMLRRFVELADG